MTFSNRHGYSRIVGLLECDFCRPTFVQRRAAPLRAVAELLGVIVVNIVVVVGNRLVLCHFEYL